MAQQLAEKENAALPSPDPLHPIMEQQVEGRDHGTISITRTSNTIIQPNVEAASSSSSTLVDHRDKIMPLLHPASQNSIAEEQDQRQEHNSRAILNSPRVENGSAQPPISNPMHSGTEQQHTPLPSLPPSSGELSPNIQHSVGNHSASNIVAQQVEIKPQHRHFSLSVPTQSSIMLRRNAHPGSSSASRSSSSQETLENVNAQRVRQLINTLGFDDDLSKMLIKLVVATAPFYNGESLPTAPAPEESNPQVDALRETLDSLMFAPKSPTAEEGPHAGNSTENPTGNLLFDANAAENLGSRPLEPRSDSPPLLLSTAAVEEPLDPNAEDPTYYTIAELVNTIIENGIQVESVTEEDWWIEELRVAILKRLHNDILEERLMTEGGSNEVPVTKHEVAEGVKTKEDASESDLVAAGGSIKVPVTKETAAEEIKANGNSKEVAPTKEATEQVKAKEDTTKSDLRRWEEEGPDGWLKRDDGTDMNEEEIDEECARWDAMVTKARNEKEAKKAAGLLGKNINVEDKGFWEYVRSSKQKEQTQGLIWTHVQDEKASVTTHDQDEKANKKKNKKGSRKNKNKNRKAKKNASKGGDAEDESDEEGRVNEILEENNDGSGRSPMRLQSLDLGEKFDLLAEQITTMGLAVGDTKATIPDTTRLPETDAPEKASETMSEKVKRKALEAGKTVPSNNAGFYTPSVYSEHGKKPGSTAKQPIDKSRRDRRTWKSTDRVENFSGF